MPRCRQSQGQKPSHEPTTTAAAPRQARGQRGLRIGRCYDVHLGHFRQFAESSWFCVLAMSRLEVLGRGWLAGAVAFATAPAHSASCGGVALHQVVSVLRILRLERQCGPRHATWRDGQAGGSRFGKHVEEPIPSASDRKFVGAAAGQMSRCRRICPRWVWLACGSACPGCGFNFR